MRKIGWNRLLPAMSGALAGQVLFFVLINRILSRLRSKVSKPLIAAASWISLVGGMGALGGWLPPPNGSRLIGAIWALIISREARQRRISRRMRSTQPVEVQRIYPPQRPPRLDWRHPVTTSDLHLRHYEVHLNGSGGYSRSLRRLRIAQLSDLHANPKLPQEMYKLAVTEINRAEPDLVFLTGDYVGEAQYTWMLPDLLNGLRARHGVFAILGNHDHWAGAEPIMKRLEQMQIEYLGNGQRVIQIGPAHRPAPAIGLRLRLVGSEAPWNRSGTEPVAPAQDGEVLLALSHSADHVYQFSELGASAVFSGHYHAGQFRLPGFGALIIPSRYGRRFDHGHFQVGKTHLFVSAGMGCDRPSIRLYCPPDFFIVDLYL